MFARVLYMARTCCVHVCTCVRALCDECVGVKTSAWMGRQERGSEGDVCAPTHVCGRVRTCMSACVRLRARLAYL